MSGPPPDPLFTLRGHTSEVQTLDFHPNNSYLLVSGSSDGEVKVWDCSDRRCKQSFCPHEGGVLSVTATREHLWTHGRDGLVKQWTWIDEGCGCSSTPIAVIPVGFASFCKVVILESHGPSVIAPDVAVPTLINVWDVRNPCKPLSSCNLSVPSESQGMCTALTKTCDERMFYAGFESGMVVCYDVTVRTVLASFQPWKHPVLSLAVDATGLCGVVCGPVKTLVWFQLDPTHSVDVKPSMTTVDETKLPHTGVSTVAYRPDGKIVASSGWDGKLRVYHASKHTPLAVLNAHAGTAHSLAFGKPSEAEVFGCGGVFASAGKDGRIVVYSVFTPSSRTPARE